MYLSAFLYSALKITTNNAKINKNKAETTDMEYQVLRRFPDTALTEERKKRMYRIATGTNKTVLIIFLA